MQRWPAAAAAAAVDVSHGHGDASTIGRAGRPRGRVGGRHASADRTSGSGGADADGNADGGEDALVSDLDEAMPGRATVTHSHVSLRSSARGSGEGEPPDGRNALGDVGGDDVGEARLERMRPDRLGW